MSWRQVWEAGFLMPSCRCPQPHPCFGPWADNCFPLACDSLLRSVVSTSSECADKGPGMCGVRSSKAPPSRVQEGAEALSYGLPQGAGGEGAGESKSPGTRGESRMGRVRSQCSEPVRALPHWCPDLAGPQVWSEGVSHAQVGQRMSQGSHAQLARQHHHVVLTCPLGSMKVKVKSLTCVRLFATPQTIAYQVPPSMGFSRQEYWSGLPFPSPADLPNPGIEPRSPALQTDALPSEPPSLLKPQPQWSLWLAVFGDLSHCFLSSRLPFRALPQGWGQGWRT